MHSASTGRAAPSTVSGESPQQETQNVLAVWARALDAPEMVVDDLNGSAPTWYVQPKPRHQAVTLLAQHWMGWNRDRSEVDGLLDKPLAVVELTSKQLSEKADRVRPGAQTDLETIVAAGLARRVGETLRTLPISPRAKLRNALQIQIRANRDWLIFDEVLMGLREQLGHGRTEPVAGAPCVCDACTSVFWPARKGYAIHCPACAKRPARSEMFDGSRADAGKGVAFPLRQSGLAGRPIVSWGSIYTPVCAECREPFFSRRPAKFCSPACGKRHRRRV